MKCSKFEQSLSNYLDGLLARGETSLFAEHALQCRSCRALLDDVKSALRECKLQSDVIMPAGLEATLVTIAASHVALDCCGFEELITEFLDGFVPAGVYHRFEAHVEQCGRCSELLTDVVYAVAACHSVHTYEAFDIEDALAERLLAIMPEQLRATRKTFSDRMTAFVALLIPKRTHSAPWSFTTASALAFASFAFLLFGFSDDQTVAGIYRQAHVKAAALYTQGADIYAHKQQVVAELQRVGEDIGEIWETIGGGGLTGNEIEKSKEPSKPTVNRKPAQSIEKN